MKTRTVRNTQIEYNSVYKGEVELLAKGMKNLRDRDVKSLVNTVNYQNEFLEYLDMSVPPDTWITQLMDFVVESEYDMDLLEAIDDRVLNERFDVEDCFEKHLNGDGNIESLIKALNGFDKMEALYEREKRRGQDIRDREKELNRWIN